MQFFVNFLSPLFGSYQPTFGRKILIFIRSVVGKLVRNFFVICTKFIHPATKILGETLWNLWINYLKKLQNLYFKNIKKFFCFEIHSARPGQN